MLRHYVPRLVRLARPTLVRHLSGSEVLADLEKHGDATVKLAFTDVDGVLRGKYINLHKFKSSIDKSIGVCNVVFGWDITDTVYDSSVQYTGAHTGYPDAQARVQLDTYRRLPWEGQGSTPMFLLEFHKPDQPDVPLPQCPRALLGSVLKQAAQLGYRPMAGLEFEWFNFAETAESLQSKKFVDPQPITPGMHGYSILRTAQNSEFFHAILNNTQALGVPLEGLHTETGPGVYEAAIQYTDALAAADRAVLFKMTVKQTAHSFGIIPCFMAKWNENLPGTSGHLHQSLIDTSTGANVFYSATDPNEISDTLRHYIAGQIACLPHILPMFAPNVNSFKRQVPGYWAPTRASWAIDNRTVALRVLPGGPKGTRLETRIGGADANPYYNCAASIASGLYGIRHKLELPPPVTGTDIAEAGDEESRLPSNLYEAAKKMRSSPIAKELFGEEFVDHYSATRLWEWKRFQKAVTTWELDRYFELA